MWTADISIWARGISIISLSILPFGTVCSNECCISVHKLYHRHFSTGPSIQFLRIFWLDVSKCQLLQEPSKEEKLKKIQDAQAEAVAKIDKVKAEHQNQIQAQQTKHIEEASKIQKSNQEEFLKLKYQHDLEMLPLLQKDNELDQLIKLKSAPNWSIKTVLVSSKLNELSFIMLTMSLIYAVTIPAKWFHSIQLWALDAHVSRCLVWRMGSGWMPVPLVPRPDWYVLQIWPHFPAGSIPRSVRDWPRIEVRTISRAHGESPVNIYVSHGQIVAITTGARLRSKASSRPGVPLPSLFSLPDFIALP